MPYLDLLFLSKWYCPQGAPPDTTPPLSLRPSMGGRTAPYGVVPTDTHKGPRPTPLHPCPYGPRWVGEPLWCDYQRPTPTCTLRKRAGAAPCPVRIVCIGSPLPQLGVPHTTHSSRLLMASHCPQNFCANPVDVPFFSL